MTQQYEEPSNGKAFQRAEQERRHRADAARQKHRPADDFVELDELHRSFWGISSESLQNYYDN